MLCAYWLAFDVHVTRTENLQRPDFRELTEQAGPPHRPRAIVTWVLAADGPASTWRGSPSASTAARTGCVRWSWSASRCRGPSDFATSFHPAERLRLKRLTLIRYVSRRPREIGSTRCATCRPVSAATRSCWTGARGERESSEIAYRLRAGMRQPGNWVQLFKFGVVGGSGYLVNLAVFAALAAGLGLHYAVAAVGAFCVAVTNNFLLNRYWTFGAGERAGRLPGGALLRGQRRLAADQPRHLEALVAGEPRWASCRRRRLRSPSRCRSTSSATGSGRSLWVPPIPLTWTASATAGSRRAG